MPKRTTTPVRFTEEQDDVLKRIAAACRVKEADVARWAVEALGAYWAAHGGRLLLPLDFTQRFTVQTEPPMILPDPSYEHELESVSVEGGGRIRKSGRPRGAQA